MSTQLEAHRELKSPKQQSQQLWAEFQKHFEEVLRTAPPCEVAWAWKSAANRTSFYRNRVLPKVARNLGFIDAYELFRVDSTFCLGESRDEQETLVPIIHVESENHANSAGHEVRKLCALTSRLKVLITCDIWSKKWTRGGHASEYQESWRALIENHLRHYPDDCEYGLIVAERHGIGPLDRVYFHSMTLTGPRPVTPNEHGREMLSVALYSHAPCAPNDPIAPKPETLFSPLKRES